MRSCSRHGQTPLWLTKANQKRASFGQREIEQAFVAGDHFEAHLGEHLAVVGDDGGEGDVVDAGGQQLGGLVAFELQGELEGGLDQAIGEVGRGGRQVLLQRARDALPFGGLAARREERRCAPAGGRRPAR